MYNHNHTLYFAQNGILQTHLYYTPVKTKYFPYQNAHPNKLSEPCYSIIPFFFSRHTSDFFKWRIIIKTITGKSISFRPASPLSLDLCTYILFTCTRQHPQETPWLGAGHRSIFTFKVVIHQHLTHKVTSPSHSGVPSVPQNGFRCWPGGWACGSSGYPSESTDRSTCCTHMVSLQCECTHALSFSLSEMHGRGNRGKSKVFLLCGSAHGALDSPW